MGVWSDGSGAGTLLVGSLVILHRDLVLVALLLVYWERIRAKVNLMGTEISMNLRALPAEEGQERTLMERGWPGYNGLLQVT